VVWKERGWWWWWEGRAVVPLQHRGTRGVAHAPPSEPNVLLLTLSSISVQLAFSISRRVGPDAGERQVLDKLSSSKELFMVRERPRTAAPSSRNALLDMLNRIKERLLCGVWQGW
jgi:hypothetical protein